MCSINASKQFTSMNQSINILIKFEGKIQNNTTNTGHKHRCNQGIPEY